METWRLLDMPPMTAAENMALDETLLSLKGERKSPNTIRFMQFSPRSVLIGYHQSIQEEVRKDFCNKNGIDINRRITGGGAIFFDENQLGWELICDKKFFNLTLPTQSLFKRLCTPVATAIGMLGIAGAKFRPRNDIEIDGRKISGTGGTESGDAFLFQGTMLTDFDVDTMLRSLRIPVEKLKSKEIDSVKERVTCLKWELGSTPSLRKIKNAIIHAFEEGLGIRLKPGGLTGKESTIFKGKLNKFKSDRWIELVNPKYQKKDTIQSAYKADAGMIRYSLSINKYQNIIKDIYITGDFLAFPSRSLYDLENSLRGKPLDRRQLHAIIKMFFSSGKMHVPGMDFEDFIIPLNQILDKIAISKYGISIEHCNRISVVNGSFEEVISSKPSVLLLPYCAKLTHCDLRYKKDCRICNEDPCTIGPAWHIAQQLGLRVISIRNFEDLWSELLEIKRSEDNSFIGCCCQPFFAKHFDDFVKAGLPGILLDIDSNTCYDLDQAKEAYAGKFESQTMLDLNLLKAVLKICTMHKGNVIKDVNHTDKHLAII